MRKRNLVLGMVAVMAVLAIVGAELVGNAVYYVRHGELFYARVHKAPDPGAFTTTQAVFHPYLSFIHRAGRDGDWWTTNNKGFQVLTRLVQEDPACCNYPMPKRNDEVLVGVFGGSVATGFALHTQQYPEFAALLAAMPQWKGKRIRILNFSMPGYKQPQQLIALAYFLSIGQHFDLILNIDGFNEVITTARNFASGAEPSFPADTLWGASGREIESQMATAGANGDGFLAAYYRIEAESQKRNAEACNFATCYVYYGLRTDYARRRSAQLEASLRAGTQKTTLFPTSVQSRFGNGFDIFEYAADQWAASSKSMAALASAAGVPYLHVLQPNQWLKSYGEYEPITSVHMYGWMIKLVNGGYPELIEEVPAMQAAGVPIWDATGLFKGMPWRDVYYDDCCHYTNHGNALLAERIVERLRPPAVPSIDDKGQAAARPMS
jgi:hypothetical protein